MMSTAFYSKPMATPLHILLRDMRKRACLSQVELAAVLGMAQPTKLLGQPLYEASDMVATVTTGSNILLAGDFSEYLIYDRIGVSIEYVPQVFDTSTGRPTGQRGYLAHWRVGADVLNSNAFRVLKL